LNECLRSWYGDVSNGTLPAVVLNSTITETGERLLLGTTQLSKNNGSLSCGKARKDMSDLFPAGQDLQVVTAARLSASFPYVTPAARAKLAGPQPHVVDGGYYDNYGMSTLVEWLDEALKESLKREHPIRNVLVIQVHGAPLNESDLHERQYAKSRGWFYQAIAPLLTLNNVRDTGQVAHNNIELELLKEKWASRGVNISSTLFEFSEQETPLSWHLTPDEKEKIRKVWGDMKKGKDFERVMVFLSETGQGTCAHATTGQVV